jgi:predicted polyphosphate/ATP-dependent NAD kinase
MLIGFIVNPIAGMGGRVGLKGTDNVYDEAINRGAKPIASEKALSSINFLVNEFADILDDVTWLTCKGNMGSEILIRSGIKKTSIKSVYTPSSQILGDTSTADTVNACKKFVNAGVSLIVFCGGDGTARDVVSVVKDSIPILGIPSGVKMHSGVFAVTSTASGEMIGRFIKGELSTGEAEIMDLDEKLYRKGTWKVRLYNTAQGIIEPSYIQVGKASFAQMDDDEIKDDIADHIKDEITKYKDHLFIFGSGGTIDYIAHKIGVTNTILGIDAIYQNKTIAKDVNENELLELLRNYSKIKIILSPIGAQGFILGRGNLQLSPPIIRKVGIDNIIVISTPSKLKATPVIRVDTGDADLDKEFVDYCMMMVVIGYRMSRVVKIKSV